MSLLLLVGLVLAAIMLWVLYLRWQEHRRERLFHQALAPDSIRILEKNVALYSLLPQSLRQQLHGRVNIFLQEKKFIGCGGFEITDEVRFTIAGNACLLLLQRDKCCFPGFTSILVYPDTYVARQVNYDGLIQTSEETTRSGESWYRGPVVLSWADVLRGVQSGSDGHNVVLHEFAHKLDEENQHMDGLPVLRDRSHYAEWEAVLSQEYESLLIRIEQGTNAVLDEYAAVSPAEFFAVATEAFFEKSTLMKNRLPELYQQLQQFYHLDPAAWQQPA